MPRYLGALAVLAVGLVDLQQYFGPYVQIPTIGTLFLVNFAAAAAISLRCWRRWNISPDGGRERPSRW